MAGLPSIFARVSASRNVQIVFASGTASASSSSRKRMNESRSLIRNSVRSSDSEWLACRVRIFHMNTWPNAGRPPFEPSDLSAGPPAQDRAGTPRNLQSRSAAREHRPSRRAPSGLINIEEAHLTSHRPTPDSPTSRESQRNENNQVLGGVQLIEGVDPTLNVQNLDPHTAW